MTVRGVSGFLTVRRAVGELAGQLGDVGGRLEECLSAHFNVVALVKRFCGKVADEGFHVAMLGSHGTGKSAFLNRVMDDEILREGVPATTSALVFLAQGQGRSAFVQFKPVVRVHVRHNGRLELECARAAAAWLRDERDAVRRLTLVVEGRDPQEITPDDAALMLSEALGVETDAAGRTTPEGFGRVETIRGGPDADTMLEFEFEVAEPLRFDLSESENLRDFQAYSSDIDKAMLVDFITVEHPGERLRGIVFVDTPGLSSLVEYHRLTTREFVREADGLIVFLDARIPSLRHSDKRTIEELARWLKNRDNQVVYFVANFTDRLAARGELVGLDESAAMDAAQREMTSVVSAMLTGAGWNGFDPEHFFFVDSSRGTNVAEVVHALGADVAARKSTVLTENWRRHLLGYCGTIAGIAEAHLKQFREIRSGNEAKEHEHAARAAAVEQASENVKAAAAGLQADAQGELANYLMAVGGKVDGLERKRDFLRFLEEWPQCREDLVERLKQAVSRGSQSITRLAQEGIREGISENIEIPVPEMDAHRYILPEEHVMAPLGGFWWGLKRVLSVILPWRLTRKNIETARADLSEAIDGLRAMLLLDIAGQVERVRHMAELYLEDARTVLESTRGLQRQYRDNAQAASAKVAHLHELAAALEDIAQRVPEAFAPPEEQPPDEAPAAEPGEAPEAELGEEASEAPADEASEAQFDEASAAQPDGLLAVGLAEAPEEKPGETSEGEADETPEAQGDVLEQG